MKSSKSRLDALPVRLATLLGTASFFTISNALDAYAGRGGRPGGGNPRDGADHRLADPRHGRGRRAGHQSQPARFRHDRRADHRRSVPHLPAANVMPPAGCDEFGRQHRTRHAVNLRGLDTGTATRSLLMVDGMRFPAQGNGQCVIDPSIIPALSHRPHRRPGRRRVGDLRLGRHRRRDQHHPEAQHGRRDHAGRAGRRAQAARTDTSPPLCGAGPGTAARSR